MPYLGSLFGISEDATALLLVEIGRLKRYKSGKTVMRRQGWDGVAAEFEFKKKI